LKAKRVFDVVSAFILLVALSPVMLFVALLIVAKMGRPVFFQQQRPGLHDVAFKLCKFRTMDLDRSNDDSGLSDSQRLTGLGRVLRSASLDELPELWNVLKGEMSLVGPRPLLMRYLPFYSERERLRHSVRPGITGWAQVRGRNHASWDQRLSDDVWYVQNRTFSLDIKILLQTVAVVFRRSGVEVDTRSAMLNLDEERRGVVSRSEIA
jgi:sugar transferase EpsL